MDKNNVEDDFDVDREQPREEQKFDMINSTNTLTTVNENQSDYLNDTLGALNRDNNLMSGFQRMPEMTMTAKRDDDRALITTLMRQ